MLFRLRASLDRGFELWTAAFLAAFYVCQHQRFESSADSHGQPVRRVFPGGGDIGEFEMVDRLHCGKRPDLDEPVVALLT